MRAYGLQHADDHIVILLLLGNDDLHQLSDNGKLYSALAFDDCFNRRRFVPIIGNVEIYKASARTACELYRSELKSAIRAVIMLGNPVLLGLWQEQVWIIPFGATRGHCIICRGSTPSCPEWLWRATIDSGHICRKNGCGVL